MGLPAIRDAPCVYSPVLEELRATRLPVQPYPPRARTRAPASVVHELQTISQACLIAEAFDTGSLANQDAVLIVGDDVPGFCLPFATGMACLLWLLQNDGLLGELLLTTADLRAGLAVEGASDCYDPEQAYVLCTWDSRG